MVLPDGSQTCLNHADFTLETLDEWTSPTTGITYPSRWRLTAPSDELDLEIIPLIRDQEMYSAYVY